MILSPLLGWAYIAVYITGSLNLHCLSGDSVGRNLSFSCFVRLFVYLFWAKHPWCSVTLSKPGLRGHGPLLLTCPSDPDISENHTGCSVSRWQTTSALPSEPHVWDAWRFLWAINREPELQWMVQSEVHTELRVLETETEIGRPC